MDGELWYERSGESGYAGRLAVGVFVLLGTGILEKLTQGPNSPPAIQSIVHGWQLTSEPR